MSVKEMRKIMESMSERQSWNMIMKMVGNFADKNPSRVEDVGFKKDDGYYHEFMIDGRVFVIKELK